MSNWTVNKTASFFHQQENKKGIRMNSGLNSCWRVDSYVEFSLFHSAGVNIHPQRWILRVRIKQAEFRGMLAASRAAVRTAADFPDSPILKSGKNACWSAPQSPGITIRGELRVWKTLFIADENPHGLLRKSFLLSWGVQADFNLLQCLWTERPESAIGCRKSPGLILPP